MKVKRQPTLADRFLATPQQVELYAPHFLETTKDHLRQAHRFMFDKEAIRYVGEMIRDMPRIIADAQDFAIPPFKQTWIEFDSRVLYEAVTGTPALQNSDSRVGYLITGSTARVIVDSEGVGGDPLAIPFQYRLFQPWSIAEELAFCDTAHMSRIGLDAMFWGSTAGTFMQESDKEGLRALRANHSIELCCTKEYEDHIVASLASSMAGDLRNVIALLLFMNRTRDDIVLKEHSHAQGFVKNRTVPFLKHSVISLKLNPRPRLIKLVAGHGATRRLHDVRGHFCHNHEARHTSCSHEWEETKPLHWECQLKCGGVRWWRAEHSRGNKEKGEVTSHYHVTE